MYFVQLRIAPQNPKTPLASINKNQSLPPLTVLSKTTLNDNNAFSSS